jgi:hypothetical protein
MWMRIRQLDAKTRRWLAKGNISLIMGLLLWMFIHPHGQTAKDWLDGVCGFLLGLSIAINLLGLWKARRCRAAGL